MIRPLFVLAVLWNAAFALAETFHSDRLPYPERSIRVGFWFGMSNNEILTPEMIDWIGQRAFLDRAVRELRTVVAFPDWAPHSFLDTSEMMHAVAIGYDWLYHDLLPEDRQLLRQAIQEKGLAVGLRDYERGKTWTVAGNS